MKELLSSGYYQNSDVISLTRDMIGKLIVTEIDDITTSGIIVETEAYKAPEDKASHAYDNRMTSRTKTMFEAGGTSYIYLIYGFHHLFNIVTGPQGLAHAVLIRAVEPVEGIDIMIKRRKMLTANSELTNGPGKWTCAMGITTKYNGLKLFEPESSIKIYDTGSVFLSEDIISSSRVGIPYAQDYIDKPWRFRLKGNGWIGK
jgi:DNA-3-methyladenine glycosylase